MTDENVICKDYNFMKMFEKLKIPPERFDPSLWDQCSFFWLVKVICNIVNYQDNSSARNTYILCSGEFLKHTYIKGL